MRRETTDARMMGVRRETIDARMLGARRETRDEREFDARHETLDASHASRLTPQLTHPKKGSYEKNEAIQTPPSITCQSTKNAIKSTLKYNAKSCITPTFSMP